MSTEIARKAVPVRIPPRRRKPRRTLMKNFVWPVVKYGCVAVVALMLGKLVACKLIRPFQLCSTEGREERRLRTELSDLRKERVELERKISYLNTPEGVAQAARKLGYVKPGEITLVMPEQGGNKHAPRNAD